VYANDRCYGCGTNGGIAIFLLPDPTGSQHNQEAHFRRQGIASAFFQCCSGSRCLATADGLDSSCLTILDGMQGGQLARRCHPARVITFIISDVVGDPLDVIASGPFVPDGKWRERLASPGVHCVRDKLAQSAIHWLTDRINRIPPPATSLYLLISAAATTFADCMSIVNRLGIAERLPASVLQRLQSGK